MIKNIAQRAWILLVYLYLVIDAFVRLVYIFFASRSKEAKAISILVLAFVVSKLWTLWPESDVLYDNLILITKQPITKRTHYFFVFSILSNVLSLSILYVFAKKHRWAIHSIITIFALDLLDYWIMYGEPLFKVGGDPVEYGLIKGISLVCLCVLVFISEIYSSQKI
jgi:hypothetical protein